MGAGLPTTAAALPSHVAPRRRATGTTAGGNGTAVRGRGRPLSLGLLVTLARVALPAGVGVAAVSLTVGGALAGTTAGAPASHAGGSGGSGATHSGGSGAAHRGPCSGRAPARLHLKRLSGSQARLSWSAPSAARGSSVLVYRVLRAGRTVGQTYQPSMVLAVVPGRHTTFAVQARYGNGTLKCTAQLSETVRVRTPEGYRDSKVLTRTATGAVIGWRAAHRGDAPIAGYRVSLDGAVSGQTRALRYTLILSSSHSHHVTVAAVDTRDRLGASGRALLIRALGEAQVAGAPPSMPEGVSAADVSGTEATIVWLPSRRGAAPLSGYRVYRDGTLVGQTSSTSLRLTHLAFPQTYAITVAAVDTDGAESAHSGPLKLTTAHPAPTPPSLLSATNVTDTSATLAWQAGTAADGTVNGYLLFENGAPEGFVDGQIVTVALASARSYTFSVRTRDSDGYLSAPSADLKVVTSHTPPPAPQGLVAAAVTSSSAQISWQPSSAVSGNIVGYRLFRDGIPVGQSSATQRTLEGLAAGAEYTITVSAVDSMGAISEPSQPLALNTAPPPPTHGNVQAFLLATTTESFTDLQAHYEQIGVLYPTYFQCGRRGDDRRQRRPARHPLGHAAQDRSAPARELPQRQRRGSDPQQPVGAPEDDRTAGRILPLHTATAESRSTSRTLPRPSANRSPPSSRCWPKRSTPRATSSRPSSRPSTGTSPPAAPPCTTTPPSRSRPTTCW